MTETALSKSIQDALKALGFWVLRIPAGQYKGAGGSRVHVAEKGCPDLLVVGVGWLEVKTPKGALSPEQVAWHAKAEARGVRVAVVTSAREAAEVVLRWSKEKAA